jgi:hypothetical protein
MRIVGCDLHARQIGVWVKHEMEGKSKLGHQLLNDFWASERGGAVECPSIEGAQVRNKSRMFGLGFPESSSSHSLQAVTLGVSKRRCLKISTVLYTSCYA